MVWLRISPRNLSLVTLLMGLDITNLLEMLRQKQLRYLDAVQRGAFAYVVSHNPKIQASWM
jgi:hypothetical protein